MVSPVFICTLLGPLLPLNVELPMVMSSHPDSMSNVPVEDTRIGPLSTVTVQASLPP